MDMIAFKVIVTTALYTGDKKNMGCQFLIVAKLLATKCSIFDTS